MKYVRLDATNPYASEPVLHYCELDESRAEIRKVEIFINGHADWASVDRANGRTKLNSLPELHDVSKRLEPLEISREEFEWVWNRWVR